MEKVYLYNSLSRKKEEFIPISPDLVGLYTCGPTVYNYAHLGNLRAFLFEDFLKRTLLYNGYNVFHVQNITDVGHLTGDMDMGEDKMEKGAKREGLSAWDVAEKYTKAFKKDLKLLNILDPSIWEKVTDNIPEQIELIKELETRGYSYIISDGVYFDTSKFPEYNKLSHLSLDELKEGARVEINKEKKNPTDFALWKFSPADSKRQMEWDSPWGIGFPGWHIECSAISLKHLSNNLDIHCGGVDHINVHHTNEIAQSEAATGKKFFNYWMHGAFLNILGGKKMAKSGNNFLSLEKALLDKNIHPLAYRLAALQVHYRKPMEYSESSLEQAQSALFSLYRHFIKLDRKDSVVKDDAGIGEKVRLDFLKAINDDLNTAQALAIANSVFKADLSDADKVNLLLDFDKVLGLSLDNPQFIDTASLALSELPEEVQKLVAQRIKARQEKDFSQADSLRADIEAAGYLLKDEKDELLIFRK